MLEKRDERDERERDGLGDHGKWPRVAEGSAERIEGQLGDAVDGAERLRDVQDEAERREWELDDLDANEC